MPGYEADYDPNEDTATNKEGHEDSRRDYDRPPAGEPLVEEEDDVERYDQAAQQRQWQQQKQQQQQQAPPSPLPATSLEPGQAIDPNSGLPYDAQREREDLIARNQGVRGWKNAVKRGLETALLGGGTG